MATLSEMNEKQRVKEFKRIAKELKSKDVSVREGAIKIAFEEHAYLVEGKGLLSLLEGVTAKKVYLPFFSHPHSILLSISFILKRIESFVLVEILYFKKKSII